MKQLLLLLIAMTLHKQQPETVSAFSNHLKAFRTQRGLSQSDLATRAGITSQAISAIESNLYLPTTAVALRLALLEDADDHGLRNRSRISTLRILTH